MLLTDYLKIQKATVPVAVERNSRQATMNGRSVASKSGVSRWKFDLTTVPMKEADFLPLSAAVNAQGGVYGVFQVRLPFGQDDSLTTPAEVDAQATVGSRLVTIANRSPVPVGTFIKFSGHAKVYQVTASTATTIECYPKLEQTVLLNESVILDRPLFTVAFSTNDMAAVAVSAGMIAMPYTFSCIEVV